MRAISIWQPYSGLIVHGHKFIETRGWPAPKSLIGQRIAIHSTKVITPGQHKTMADPHFRKFYDDTGMPELAGLPHGCILGFVTLHSCAPISQEDFDDVTEEEIAFGWWEIGRYAWRLRDPQVLKVPCPAVGRQGVWEWKGHDVINDLESHCVEVPRREMYVA